MLFVTCFTCYMSQISRYKQFYRTPSVSYIFGKLMQNTVQLSWLKCYMSNVLHVTCHTCYMSQMTLEPCILREIWIDVYWVCHIFFWKAHAKYSSMVIIKTLHVTCFTCHMWHMLHVTNIKLQTILPKTPCVIYFWKAHAKYSSMVMKKLCMSHVLHVMSQDNTTHQNATPQNFNTSQCNKLAPVKCRVYILVSKNTYCNFCSL